MTPVPLHLIESAAHGGAFGQNPTPEPSEAQCRAGNYKVGRASIYGLNIAIEQPRGSTRSGVDQKTGKPWSSRMAAHYGYINGTAGADGDCVDCFIGFDTQAERAYVINQNIGGKFDEHKVMLAFPDLVSARRAYLDSYERGWDGLESIVPASLSQLKWWLKNGDTKRPLRADNLPKEGLETMTKKTHWNGDALPCDTSLAQVLYDIRRSDGGEGLLLDAVTAQEIIEDADGALAFDALVTPYVKLERRMELLRGVMERTGDKVKPVALQITDPFKQRGVANVAAIFELSDGQTVTIFFHNPDVTPNKMAPTDEVISWKWLLNKKDITIVVAPERGADLNIREVARRIMRLAEKNSDAFQRVNATRAARMQNIQTLKDEIATLETDLATAQRELEVAKVAAEDAQNRKSREYAEAVQRVNETGDAYIRAGENGGIDPKTGKTKEELRALSDAQAAEAQRLKDIANGTQPKEPEFDPTSPEGYAQVMADEALQLYWQDRLDAFFQGRIVAVRNALRALGWEGRAPSDTRLYKEGAEVQPTFTHVGAGRNVAGWAMNDIADDLTKTPEEYAAQVDAAAMAEVARRAQAAKDAQQKPDITYRNSADNLFTSFFPNTPDGEKAWNIINATPGAEGGKVLAVHAEPTIAQLREAGYTVAEDTSAPASAEEVEAMLKELGGADTAGQQDDIQKLIDAYVQSFSAAADVLNAAVASVNWDGITNSVTARAETDKLNIASRTGQYGIIGKASQALEAAGIKTWDERLSSLRDAPGFSAWSAALDSASAARDKIQTLAKERLIATGTSEVAALTADSPLADVAAAVFHKAGIDMGDKMPGIVAAIEAKDADLAWSILRNLDNKASAEIFERATGVKLAKTQRDRHPQIDAWAGITPERRAEIEAQRTEAQAAKERDDNLKRSWSDLAGIYVRTNDGAVSSGQDFLKSLFAQGFDEVIARKKGATTAYYVRNGDRITGLKSKSFNGFLKAALAFGGLRQALESLGVVEPQAEKTDAEKIAAVDEAYRFTSATDEFKLWLSESVLKGDYSPFATAKGMDEAAKRHGAGIEWGEFAGAAMDDTGHAVAALQAALGTAEANEPVNRAEGDAEQADLEAEVAASIKEAIAILTEGNYEPDEAETGVTFDVETALDSAAGVYVETDKRAIAATKALLKYFRDFLASDAKFAKVPTSVYGWMAEGDVMDKEDAKRRLGKLIDVAINRKAGIPDLTPKEEERLADYAHDARTISDYLTRRIRHTGSRNLLRTPELKAKYPYIDNQPAMDSAALDGVDEDGYVGKVKKGDQVLGRIDIGDDGKAMVYVGEAGDERVKGREGRPFMYSEDDAPEMVEALFVAEESPAAAQAEAFAGPAKDRMAALKVLTDTGMNHWMSESQNKAVIAGLMGEEWQFFADKMKELAGVIAAMPKTYDQDGKGDEAVAHLHYFRGAADWYITEKDMEGRGTEQAFGLADLYGDGGELGYISIIELTEAGVELDFHFEPKTIGQIRGGASDASEEQPKEPAGGKTESGEQVDYTKMFDPAVIKEMNVIKHLRDSVLAAQHEGNSETVIESDRILSLFVDTLTPQEFKGYDHDKAEGVLFAKLHEIERELGLGAESDPQKDADRALFQSVIDGTVPDILAPDLADSLEAAFNRNQGDPEMVSLFEQAVAAYQNAMLAATANLS